MSLHFGAVPIVCLVDCSAVFVSQKCKTTLLFRYKTINLVRIYVNITFI